ncbi:MAG: hypothetical protein DRN66_00420 [Candidatus Nanohalarchaeota archaeon]|nr:MAG: hypothetical protein DRN66_00420 [Candidatus Nanohaloarchaeota archaeon]
MKDIKAKTRNNMVSARTLFFYAVLGLGAYILSPFLVVIILSFLTAYAMYPFLKLVRKYVKYKSVALFLLISWVFIPLYFFSILTYMEFQKLIPLFPAIQQWVSNWFVYINAYMPDIIAKYNLSAFVQSGTQDLIGFSSQIVIAGVTKLAINLPWFLFQFLLYIFSTYYILYDFDTFSKKLNRYIEITSADKKCIIKNTVTGIKNSFNFFIVNYLVLAAIIGLVSYIVFLAAGLPFALLFSIIIGLITLVPNIGPWLFITIIGIAYYFAATNINGAIGIIAYSLIGFIAFEYYIRPILGAKAGGVHPLTTLFGVLGGAICFGTKGVLIGPIVLIVAETFIRAHYDLKEKEAEEEAKKKPASIKTIE